MAFMLRNLFLSKRFSIGLTMYFLLALPLTALTDEKHKTEAEPLYLEKTYTVNQDEFWRKQREYDDAIEQLVNLTDEKIKTIDLYLTSIDLRSKAIYLHRAAMNKLIVLQNEKLRLLAEHNKNTDRPGFSTKVIGNQNLKIQDAEKNVFSVKVESEKIIQDANIKVQSAENEMLRIDALKEAQQKKKNEVVDWILTKAKVTVVITEEEWLDSEDYINELSDYRIELKPEMEQKFNHERNNLLKQLRETLARNPNAKHVETAVKVI